MISGTSIYPRSLSVLTAGCLLATPFLSRAAEGTKGLLLVANKGDQALAIIDPESNHELATIPEEGLTGHEVVAAKDGVRAFVPIYGSSGVGQPGTDGQIIRVLDLQKRSIVGTVQFPHGVRPHCARIAPALGRAMGCCT